MPCPGIQAPLNTSAFESVQAHPCDDDFGHGRPLDAFGQPRRRRHMQRIKHAGAPDPRPKRRRQPVDDDQDVVQLLGRQEYTSTSSAAVPGMITGKAAPCLAAANDNAFLGRSPLEPACTSASKGCHTTSGTKKSARGTPYCKHTLPSRWKQGKLVSLLILSENTVARASILRQPTESSAWQQLALLSTRLHC